MKIAIALVTMTSIAAADIAREPPATMTAPHVAPPNGGMARPMPMPPPPPPPPPQPPTPPAEVTKLGKDTVGNYKCKGVSLRGDGSSTPLEATLAIKLDLDNIWIQALLVETKVGGIKLADYRTYDPTAKQWTRIQLASTSAHVISTSLGERDGKWTWEGSAVSPSGTLQVRDYEQRDAKQLKVWGEAMLGGTWQKQYEATCKK